MPRHRTGPGNKGKRERLAHVIRYIDERLDRLNDHPLLAEDLEVGSGAIEGAVKSVIGKRCGHAGNALEQRARRGAAPATLH